MASAAERGSGPVKTQALIGVCFGFERGAAVALNAKDRASGALSAMGFPRGTDRRPR